MRSPILPIRQAGRICDACRQQRIGIRSCSRSLSLSRSYTSTTRAPLTISNPRTTSSQREAPDRIIPQRGRLFSTSPLALQSSPQPSSASKSTPSGVGREEEAEQEGIGNTTGAAAPDHNETKAKAKAKAGQVHVPRSHYDFFPRTLPLGPPPAGPFAIDTRALRREFLALQGGAHPDLHPSHLKSRAEAASARINEAYRTLESPLARAQHLLSLRGREGIADVDDERGRVEDPELLTLVLETREAIEDAAEEADLEGLRQENEDRVGRSEDRLARLFAADDLAGAAAEVVRLRYWVNIRESIRNWERGKPVVLEH